MATPTKSQNATGLAPPGLAVAGALAWPKRHTISSAVNDAV